MWIVKLSEVIKDLAQLIHTKATIKLIEQHNDAQGQDNENTKRSD